MSFLQRVSSIESFSPVRGRSPASATSRDRKLSFSPFPGAWDPIPTQEVIPAIGAFEVPKAKRIRKFFVITNRDAEADLTPTYSTGRSCCYILPLCRRDCLWLRCPQTSLDQGTGLSISLYAGRIKSQSQNMFCTRDTFKSYVHRCSRRDQCCGSSSRCHS